MINIVQKKIYKNKAGNGLYYFNIYDMKFILEYKSYKPIFNIGDKILITYWYLKEEDCPNTLRKKILTTPVIIKEKLTRGRFLISHNIDNSKLKNAPDEIINRSHIIDHLR